jgi:hypothetical protein
MDTLQWLFALFHGCWSLVIALAGASVVTCTAGHLKVRKLGSLLAPVTINDTRCITKVVEKLLTCKHGSKSTRKLLHVCVSTKIMPASNQLQPALLPTQQPPNSPTPAVKTGCYHAQAAAAAGRVATLLLRRCPVST